MTDLSLPRNIEAEAALLGAMMIDNRLIDDLPVPLCADHFFEPIHGRIYERCAALFNSGSNANPVALKPYFEGDDTLKQLGGLAYLAQLTGSGAGLIGARDFARQIYDLAILRELVSVGRHIVESACDTSESVDPQTLLDEAETRLSGVSGSHLGGDVMFGAGECATMAIDDWDRPVDGVECGIMPELDRKLGVSAPFELTIVAGRPGHGKTGFAVSYSVAAARRAMADQCETGGGVCFLSMEMSGKQLGIRMLSDIMAYSNPIQTFRIAKGFLSNEEKDRVRRAQVELARLPLTIIQQGTMTIPRLRGLVRRLKRQFERKGTPLRLLVVDYLQLMSGSRKGKDENRTAEISEISRGLKMIGMDFKIHVMALSQLSRQLEQREDKRPRLSDLRESGSIEQDADKVLFVYRHSYYHELAKPQSGTVGFETKIVNWEADKEAIKDDCELIIGKCRNGEDGQTVKVNYKRDIQAFRQY